MRQVANVANTFAASQSACQFDGHFLAHAVGDHIGRRIAKQALLQLVAPIIVVGNAAQRGLDASEDDGHIGIKFLQNFSIYDGGVFGAHVVTTVGTIGIFGAQTACGGVFVHHRVHASRGDAEEQSRAPEFLEVTKITMPVGLGHDCHPIACCLKGTSDDGRTKRGVIDVGITRE